jgi:hypothetical protein
MLTHLDFVAPAPVESAYGARDSVALILGAGQGTWTNKRINVTGIATVRNIAAISPAWSPRGTSLAYAAMPERQNLSLSDTFQELMERRIWILEFAGDAKPRQLTRTVGYRDEHPLWSAQGTHILFARLDERGRASLWVIPSEGGTPKQVIDELTPAPDPIGSYGHVDWSSLFDWWRGD